MRSTVDNTHQSAERKDGSFQQAIITRENAAQHTLQATPLRGIVSWLDLVM
jgi:hypothetical protein